MRVPQSRGNWLLAAFGIALIAAVVAHMFLHDAVGGHDLLAASLAMVGAVCVFVGFGVAQDAATVLRSWRKAKP